jgi:hypothetical protein
MELEFLAACSVVEVQFLRGQLIIADFDGAVRILVPSPESGTG